MDNDVPNRFETAADPASSSTTLTRRETLVIDLAAGTVSAGPWSTELGAGSDDPDEIFTRYLALVYEMRQIEPGTPIPLRSLDIAVLAQALTMRPADIEQRLVVLMTPGNRRLEAMRTMLKSRVGIAAAVVVAATAVGLLIVVPGGEASPGDTTDTSDVQVAPSLVEPEIGEGLTIER